MCFWILATLVSNDFSSVRANLFSSFFAVTNVSSLSLSKVRWHFRIFDFPIARTRWKRGRQPLSAALICFACKHFVLRRTLIFFLPKDLKNVLRRLQNLVKNKTGSWSEFWDRLFLCPSCSLEVDKLPLKFWTAYSRPDGLLTSIHDIYKKVYYSQDFRCQRVT